MNNGYNDPQFEDLQMQDQEAAAGIMNQLSSSAKSAVSNGANMFNNMLQNHNPKDVENINKSLEKTEEDLKNDGKNQEDEDDTDKKDEADKKEESEDGESSDKKDDEDSKGSDDSDKKDKDGKNKSDKKDKGEKNNSNKKDKDGKNKSDKKDKKPKDKSKGGLKDKLKGKATKSLTSLKIKLYAILGIAGLICQLLLMYTIVTAALYLINEKAGALKIFLPESLRVEIDDLNFNIRTNISTDGSGGNNSDIGSFGSYAYGDFKNIKVRLLTADRKGNDPKNPDLIDFEEYIFGVACAENNSNEHAFKAQLIAARSYALTRGKKMGIDELKVYQQNGYTIIPLSNSQNDQVYNPSLIGEANKDKYLKWAKDVEGMIMVDSNDNIVYTEYRNEFGPGCVEAEHDCMSQNQATKDAAAGMKYDEILMKHYGGEENGYRIIKGTFDSSSAENWKQCDSKWGNKTINSSTICSVGCALTSVSIQIARSGVPVNVSGEFNPGSFMEAHKANGGFTKEDWISWNVSGVAPKFKMVTGSSEYLCGDVATKIAKIKEYKDNGEYIVLGVSKSVNTSSTCSNTDIGHYVALDRVGSNEIYVFDPNSSKNGTLFADYDKMTNEKTGFQIIRYKVEN